MQESRVSAETNPMARNDKLVDLKQLDSESGLAKTIGQFAAPIEKLLALDRINAVYRSVCAMPANENFFDRSLKTLNVNYQVAERDFEKIPEQGPLVMVANHPYGGLEALVLGALLSKKRRDFRFVGNFLLEKIPQMRPHLLAVDPFGNRSATEQNARTLIKAVRWIRNGGALIAFPAGEVSSLKLKQRRITDPEWSPHIGALIRMMRARVVPVYFPGRNSMLFNLAGLLHPRLRTVLLPRELVNKGRRTIPVCIGKTIAWQRIKSLKSAEAITDYLRFTTYFLANRRRAQRPARKIIKLPHFRQQKASQIVSRPPLSLIRLEIEGLPPAQRLVETSEHHVYYASAEQIPFVLREIGRLRELTFRHVNEGTLKSLDCDRYDDHYYHLFLWNKTHEEVVGAYRLGLTDKIMDRFGPDGLYTRSLFDFDANFLNVLRNAVELGRSFIRPEYQKRHTSLTLLWRGIGAFLVRHPPYTILYGAVSISQDYHAISKDLMIRFLRRRKPDSKWTSRVRPRNPYHARRMRLVDHAAFVTSIRTIEDVSFLISELEQDGKGVPVLIRHYLKLNAKFVSFNIDTRFSNVVDGLMFVDLNETDPKLLKRFMGEGGYQRFVTDHLQNIARQGHQVMPAG